ncbi:hypothetical protein [Paraflavitalea speifideaquila]|uniref:hypothetical protein n=1 Tax=Paraflavitalea speifideaquila TaxID=3076558 RepID=UPI0028EFB581|nr:hypothetical protein [Paraflavitalea speifideiaquila]
MGTFKIEITAIGGHGQQRDIKDGETIDLGAMPEGTPDEIAVDFVKVLQAAGCDVKEAKIVHWPGDPSQVSDDLITGVRTGNF